MNPHPLARFSFICFFCLYRGLPGKPGIYGILYHMQAVNVVGFLLYKNQLDLIQE